MRSNNYCNIKYLICMRYFLFFDFIRWYLIIFSIRSFFSNRCQSQSVKHLAINIKSLFQRHLREKLFVSFKFYDECRKIFLSSIKNTLTQKPIAQRISHSEILVFCASHKVFLFLFIPLTKKKEIIKSCFCIKLLLSLSRWKARGARQTSKKLKFRKQKFWIGCSFRKFPLKIRHGHTRRDCRLYLRVSHQLWGPLSMSIFQNSEKDSRKRSIPEV